MKRILLIALVALLSLSMAAAAFAQTGDEKLAAAKFAAKQPDLAPKAGHYCTSPDDHHPALFALAQQYNWSYEEVLRWFCEGRFGVGEIKHAFETWVAIDHRLTPNEILALKVQLGGWGQVWQQLGVKGGGNESSNNHAKNK